MSGLGGIEHCTNLTSLRAASMLGPIDARQLAPLTRLAFLSTSTGLEHQEALQDLSGLRQLRLLDNQIHKEALTPGHPTRALLDDLKARGVAVCVAPISWSGDGRPRSFE